jgi:hypothetical protein
MSTLQANYDPRRLLFLEVAADGPELFCLTADQLARRTQAPHNNYRLSPIFPVIPAEGEVPSSNAEYYLGFFIFEDSFFVLGELLAKIPKEQQKWLWFSHGLASVLFFAEKPSYFDALKTARKDKLRAYEIWQVRNCQVTFHSKELAPPAKINRERCVMNVQVALDPEIQVIIEELRHCLNTSLVRAAQFLPSSLTSLERLFPAVNDIIHELGSLSQSSPGSPNPVCISSTGGYSDPVLSREKLRQQLTDQLIQINSALSYVISQAYSGVVPILDHECLIRNYSLLGVGAAHCGLAAFTEFCELTFQRLPVDTVVKNEFKKAPGFSYRFNPGDSSRGWDDQRFSVDFYVKDVVQQQSKLNLAYFSGRLGFRETQFTITAPLQVLTHSGTACWSLMTLTHELMHAHVRSILGAIFSPLGNGDSSKTFETWYDKFQQGFRENQRAPESLLETIRFALLNYCLQKPAIDQNATKLASASGGVPITSEVKMVDTARFATRLQAYYREINEVLVHVLDFNYFYDCREEPYLMLLWESWSPVPAVIDNVQEYLLRSLLAISSRFSGNNYARFSQAVDTLSGVLKKLSEKPDAPVLISYAFSRLRDPIVKKQLATRFSLGVYLVDIVQRCLVSKHIHAALYTDPNRTKRDLSYFYALDTGDFVALPIASPVAFIADLLRRELHTEPCCLSPEYVAAWLLLVCASAPIER